MANALASTIGLLLSALVALGRATERVDQIPTMDDEAIVLEDGTALVPATHQTVVNLLAGVRVNLTYEERNGRHVVTSIDVTDWN